MDIVWAPRFPNLGKHSQQKTWLCAESNGAKLEVYVSNSDEDGLRVKWSVKRPRRTLYVDGQIACEGEGDLDKAFARAKKLAETFALCWPEDSN